MRLQRDPNFKPSLPMVLLIAGGILFTGMLLYILGMVLMY